MNTTTDYTTPQANPGRRITVIDGQRHIDCRYCGTPVAAEWDHEGGYAYFPMSGAHLSCIHEDRNGHHVVTLTQTTTGRMTWHRYNTRKRALEMGATYREWNQREWPCGRNLEITVTSDDPKGVAYVAESF